MSSLLLRRIGELVTNRPAYGGPRTNRPAGGGDLLGLVHDAALAIRDGRVAWIGPDGDVPDHLRGGPEVDVDGRAVLPGFVDPHTHLVFAGDRSEEFARRLRGERYEEVLASGGGINATVRATRNADADELIAGARRRVERLLATGTTTAEVKSGYGLDVETERRMLEVVSRLDEESPIDLVPTWLGAHAVPPESAGDRAGFLDLLVEESLPACAPLASWADVFCDEGAFTVDEARRVLAAAADVGLALRIHADELGHSGGARLAAELGCRSADHLAHVDEADARAMADAGVVATLLPATTFSLRTGHYAPARMVIDAGVTVALGTDLNPGTSYTESMPFVVALACLELGLTPAEAVWAATRGGALALDLEDRGHLTPGALADIVVLDAPSHLHLPYRPASNLVSATLKQGVLVAGSLG